MEYRGYVFTAVTPNPPTGRPYQLMRVANATRVQTFRYDGDTPDALDRYIAAMEANNARPL
jgi:hypothetical protein